MGIGKQGFLIKIILIYSVKIIVSSQYGCISFCRFLIVAVSTAKKRQRSVVESLNTYDVRYNFRNYLLRMEV